MMWPLAIALALGALAASFAFRPRSVEPRPASYRNYDQCLRIEKGATETELRQKLGDSIGSDHDYLLFDNSPMAHGPIRAQVDKNGEVLSLRCDPTQPPLW